jgi:hypothetical protein
MTAFLEGSRWPPESLGPQPCNSPCKHPLGSLQGSFSRLLRVQPTDLAEPYGRGLYTLQAVVCTSIRLISAEIGLQPTGTQNSFFGDAHFTLCRQHPRGHWRIWPDLSITVAQFRQSAGSSPRGLACRRRWHLYLCTTSGNLSGRSGRLRCRSHLAPVGEPVCPEAAQIADKCS